MWNTIRQQLNSQYLQSRFGKTLTWHSQMAKNAFVVYTFRYLITSRSIVGICHTKMRNLIMMPYYKQETRNCYPWCFLSNTLLLEANLLGRVTRQILYVMVVEVEAPSSTLPFLRSRTGQRAIHLVNFLRTFLLTIRTTVERKRINRSVFVRNFSWWSFGFNSTSRFDGSVLNYSLR